MPKYDLNKDYDTYLGEIIAWQDKWGRPLHRTEERSASTMDKINVYDQELNKLNMLTSFGTTIEDSNLLGLTGLGRNLEQIKQQATELKYKDIHHADTRRLEIWNNKQRRWEPAPTNPGTLQLNNWDIGRRAYQGIYHGYYQGNRYVRDFQTRIVGDAARTETVMDLEGAGDYLVDYHDPEKTKIKSIISKPKDYTGWGRLFQNNNFIKSAGDMVKGQYSDYEIHFDDSGNIISEKKNAPKVLRRDYEAGRGTDDRMGIIPMLSAEYDQGKIKSLKSQDTYESQYNNFNVSSYRIYDPFDVKKIVVGDNKVKQIEEYSPYDTSISSYGSTGFYYSNQGTYLKKLSDFMEGMVTEWNKPNTKYSIVDDVKKTPIKESTYVPKIWTFTNTHTGRIQVVGDGRPREYMGLPIVENVPDYKKSGLGNVRQTASGSWVRHDSDDRGFKLNTQMGVDIFKDGKLVSSQEYRPGYGLKFTDAAVQGQTIFGQLSPLQQARNKFLNENYALDRDFNAQSGTYTQYSQNLPDYSKKKDQTWSMLPLWEQEAARSNNLKNLMSFTMGFGQEAIGEGFSQKDVSRAQEKLFYRYGGGGASRKRKPSRVLNAKSFLGDMRNLL